MVVLHLIKVLQLFVGEEVGRNQVAFIFQRALLPPHHNILLHFPQQLHHWSSPQGLFGLTSYYDYYGWEEEKMLNFRVTLRHSVIITFIYYFNLKVFLLKLPIQILVVHNLIMNF